MDTVHVNADVRTTGSTSFAETRIVTGEAVQLDVRVARVGSRMLARLIDLICQTVLWFVLTLGLQMLVIGLGVAGLVELDFAVLQALAIVSLVVTFVGYPVFMETVTRGRTPGKFVLGLRVVRDDGGPITFRHALARALVAVSIEFPGLIGAPLTWLATVVTMIMSPQSKRLGDHAAGTLVIHERTPAAWGWVPAMPPGLATWAATLDLSGLPDELALSVRHYLARNRQLREPARTQLGQRLAREVAAVTNPPPPPGTPGWAYLAAVHAERHRRAVRQLAAARGRSAAAWPELAHSALAQPAAPPRDATRTSAATTRSP